MLKICCNSKGDEKKDKSGKIKGRKKTNRQEIRLKDMTNQDIGIEYIETRKIV